MKEKKWLYIFIFDLVIGIAAIAAFVLLAVNGEIDVKWTGTLILALLHLSQGVYGIINHRKSEEIA